MSERTCRRCDRTLLEEKFPKFRGKAHGYICNACKGEEIKARNKKSRASINGLDPKEWREANFMPTVRLGGQR